MNGRILDLAKLNPNCHMNYSIIFTEISFYPETSVREIYFPFGRNNYVWFQIHVILTFSILLNISKLWIRIGI